MFSDRDFDLLNDGGKSKNRNSDSFPGDLDMPGWGNEALLGTGSPDSEGTHDHSVSA